jgi:hypothetical protein
MEDGEDGKGVVLVNGRGVGKDMWVDACWWGRWEDKLQGRRGDGRFVGCREERSGRSGRSGREVER